MQQNEGRSKAHSVAPAVPLPIAIVDAWALKRARTARAERGVRVELKLRLTARDFSGTRSAAALLQIERRCLKPYRPRSVNTDDSRYAITLDTKAGRTIDVAALRLLGRMRAIAEQRDCDLEAVIRHRSTGRYWS